jgi:hypothetical protein
MARYFPLLLNGDAGQQIGGVVIQNELEAADALDNVQITPILQTVDPLAPHVVAFAIVNVPETPA